MRAAGCRKAQNNGTQNTLQGAQIKGCSPGLQIRPRRFDSGFGLHIRKPRRPWSTGFFYAWKKGEMCSAFLAAVPHLGFEANGLLPLRASFNCER